MAATPTVARPQQQGGQGGKGQAVKPRPFRIGVQSKDEIDYDVTITATSSTQDLPVLNIPPAGFLRGLFLVAEGVAGNTGTVAVAFKEDAPFNFFETITLEDVNNQPIVGPFSGHDLYLVNKYGGYAGFGDPRNAVAPAYYALSGAGTTAASPNSAQGGAYSFVLRIPVELVARDGLGSLPNKSGTSMFKLRLRANTLANVYATAPGHATTPSIVRVRVQQINWWDPPETDLKGRPLAQNPPAVQTTQYWSKQSYPVAAGQSRQGLQRVGFLIRNLIFVLRDTNGARSASGDSAFPDPFTLQFEAIQLIVRARIVWLKLMSERYGVNSAEVLAGVAGVNLRDNGVFVEAFNLDFGLSPGAETRMGYLPTSSASRLEIQGTLGAGAATLSVLTNDVAPANGDDLQIVGR